MTRPRAILQQVIVSTTETVNSVTGDGVDNTDPNNPVLTFPTPADIGAADALGPDDNYVTDAEKTKLSNLSGTNTGDQDLSGLQALVISETALADGATIDIAQQNNTLATSRSTITFTISNTSTFLYLTITLTGTSLVLTFPANSLCVSSDGSASGDNTCTLSGVSGDVYEIAIKKRASTYSVVSKNMGQ